MQNEEDSKKGRSSLVIGPMARAKLKEGKKTLRISQNEIIEMLVMQADWEKLKEDAAAVRAGRPRQVRTVSNLKAKIASLSPEERQKLLADLQGDE